MSWAAVKATALGEGGFFVALYPPALVAELLAVPGGEPAGDLHVTLVFGADVAALGEEGVARALAAVRGVAARFASLEGRVGGVGRFLASEGSEGREVVVALPDVPGLAELRESLVVALSGAGCPPRSEHGWLPHVALGYVEPGAALPVAVEGWPLRFDALTVVAGRGGVRVRVPLGLEGAKMAGSRYGGVPRGRLQPGDFVFPETRDFPVMTAGDVRDAVASWGRYRGVQSYAAFRRNLIDLARRKGLQASLPAAWEVAGKAAGDESAEGSAGLGAGNGGGGSDGGDGADPGPPPLSTVPGSGGGSGGAGFVDPGPPPVATVPGVGSVPGGGNAGPPAPSVGSLLASALALPPVGGGAGGGGVALASGGMAAGDQPAALSPVGSGSPPSGGGGASAAGPAVDAAGTSDVAGVQAQTPSPAPAAPSAGASSPVVGAAHPRAGGAHPKSAGVAHPVRNARGAWFWAGNTNTGTGPSAPEVGPAPAAAAALGLKGVAMEMVRPGLEGGVVPREFRWWEAKAGGGAGSPDSQPDQSSSDDPAKPGEGYFTQYDSPTGELSISGVTGGNDQNNTASISIPDPSGGGPQQSYDDATPGQVGTAVALDLFAPAGSVQAYIDGLNALQSQQQAAQQGQGQNSGGGLSPSQAASLQSKVGAMQTAGDPYASVPVQNSGGKALPWSDLVGPVYERWAGKRLVERLEGFGRRWDVERAKEMVADGRPVHRLAVSDVEPWWPKVRIDAGHAASDRVDPDRPVIVMPVRDRHGKPRGKMVLDGWHRLWKAKQQGRTHVPARILTDEEARAIEFTHSAWSPGPSPASGVQRGPAVGPPLVAPPVAQAQPLVGGRAGKGAPGPVGSYAAQIADADNGYGTALPAPAADVRAALEAQLRAGSGVPVPGSLQDPSPVMAPPRRVGVPDAGGPAPSDAPPGAKGGPKDPKVQTNFASQTQGKAQTAQQSGQATAQSKQLQQSILGSQQKQPGAGQTQTVATSSAGSAGGTAPPAPPSAQNSGLADPNAASGSFAAQHPVATAVGDALATAALVGTAANLVKTVAPSVATAMSGAAQNSGSAAAMVNSGVNALGQAVQTVGNAVLNTVLPPSTGSGPGSGGTGSGSGPGGTSGGASGPAGTYTSPMTGTTYAKGPGGSLVNTATGEVVQPGSGPGGNPSDPGGYSPSPPAQSGGGQVVGSYGGGNVYQMPDGSLVTGGGQPVSQAADGSYSAGTGSGSGGGGTITDGPDPQNSGPGYDSQGNQLAGSQIAANEAAGTPGASASGSGGSSGGAGGGGGGGEGGTGEGEAGVGEAEGGSGKVAAGSSGSSGASGSEGGGEEGGALEGAAPGVSTGNSGAGQAATVYGGSIDPNATGGTDPVTGQPLVSENSGPDTHPSELPADDGTDTVGMKGGVRMGAKAGDLGSIGSEMCEGMAPQQAVLQALQVGVPQADLSCVPHPVIEALLALLQEVEQATAGVSASPLGPEELAGAITAGQQLHGRYPGWFPGNLPSYSPSDLAPHVAAGLAAHGPVQLPSETLHQARHVLRAHRATLPRRAAKGLGCADGSGGAGGLGAAGGAAFKWCDPESGRLGFYALRWGSPQEPDFSRMRDFFTPETDLCLPREGPFRAPLFDEHGMDAKSSGAPVIGYLDRAVPDGIGLWVEGQIEKDRPHAARVLGEVAAGRKAPSSDSIEHLVARAPREGGTHELIRWPFAGCSLTRRPAEPRLLSVEQARQAYKSIGRELDVEALAMGLTAEERQSLVTEAATAAAKAVMDEVRKLPALQSAGYAGGAKGAGGPIGFPAVIGERGEPEITTFRGAVKALAQKRVPSVWLVGGGSREEQAVLAAKAMITGTNSAGGYLVPIEQSVQIIPLLTARAICRAAGATVIPMDSDTLNIPSLTGGATAYWVTESSPTITTGDLTTGQVQLVTKTLAAVTVLSKQLAMSSNPSAEAVIRDALARAVSLAEDLGAIRGSGSSGQPTGIKNVSGINTFGAPYGGTTTNGGTPSFNDFSHARYLLDSNDAPLEGRCYIVHPRTVETLRNIKDGLGRNIWSDPASFFMPQFPTMQNFPNGFQPPDGFTVPNPGAVYPAVGDPSSAFYPVMARPVGYIWGEPVFSTTQIPINLTVGSNTDCSEIYYGSMPELLIGDRMAIELTASDEASTFWLSHQMGIKAVEFLDINVRHNKSFCLITGVRG